MNHVVDVVQVEPVTLAVAEAFVRQVEIPQRITGLFDVVYGWLRLAAGTGIRQSGHNYAIYDRFGPDGMRMRAGFPVSAAFAPTAMVSCVQFAGGRAVHTTHRGPYSGLRDANAAISAWCSERGLRGGGESWEVYGDWDDDPAKLITDVYVRLDATTA